MSPAQGPIQPSAGTDPRRDARPGRYVAPAHAPGAATVRAARPGGGAPNGWDQGGSAPAPRRAAGAVPVRAGHDGRGPALSRQIAVAILQAHHAYLRSDADGGLAAVARAESLCRRLDQGALAAHPDVRALLALCRGRLLLLRGDIAQARDALVLAGRAAEAPGCAELLAAALRARAVVECATGPVRLGADLLARSAAVARGVHDGLAPGSSAAAATRAWTGTAVDARARRRLAHAAAVARSRHDDVTAAAFAQAHARLQPPGDAARATTAVPADHLPGWLELWLEAASAPAPRDRGAAVDPADRAVGARQPTRVLHAAASPRGAGRPATGGPRATVRPGAAVPGYATAPAALLDRQVTSWIEESARAAQQGDLATATAALERSLRAAAPQRRREPFDTAPTAVRRLLLGLEDVRTRYPWLSGPAPTPGGPPAGPRPDVAPPAPLREPLTRRETEVLELLACLLTTDEVAMTMSVSVNTVRTHVRSILRKLDVSRRNEAVRRAWDLGILPSGTDQVAAVSAPRRLGAV